MPPKPPRIKRQISKGASQHRSRAGRVSVSVVMERDCYLNQSLQEFLLRLGRGAPDVFQRFVRVKKGGPIEELNSVRGIARNPRDIVAQASQLAPPR